jgi:hypothetical protein
MNLQLTEQFPAFCSRFEEAIGGGREGGWRGRRRGQRRRLERAEAAGWESDGEAGGELPSPVKVGSQRWAPVEPTEAHSGRAAGGGLLSRAEWGGRRSSRLVLRCGDGNCSADVGAAATGGSSLTRVKKKLSLCLVWIASFWSTTWDLVWLVAGRQI